MSEGILEKVADILGKKPAQLTAEDLRLNLQTLKRRVEEYERDAVAAEAAALANRAKAYNSPDVSSADGARLLRQSRADKMKAERMAGFASTFMAQLGNVSSLVTTMQIADDMKNVGLINSSSSVADLQKSMDKMQLEIDQLVSSSERLGEAMNIAFSQFNKGSADVKEEKDELETLLAKYKSESDPVKKAELQKKIDVRMGIA